MTDESTFPGSGEGSEAAAVALVQALKEMGEKLAAAEGRATAAEQRADHLEEQLREAKTELVRLRSEERKDAGAPTTPGVKGRGGPWWRERRRQRGSQ